MSNPAAKLFLCILTLSFFWVSPLATASLSKEEILAKYNQAITQADELNVYQDDSYRIIPRIRLAANALLNEDFPRADGLLEEVLPDLKLVATQRPAELKREFRLEWLEIYREIFQKYAFLIVFAFLFVKIPFYHRLLKQDAFNLQGLILLPFVICPAAILLSLFDLTRYGESSWAFLDIQVILLATGGLLGGFWPGLFSGLAMGIFRWILKPEIPVYIAIAVAAGFLGSLLHRRLKTYRKTAGLSFAAGAVAGLVHGTGIYLPLWQLLPWPHLLLSIAFLALLEGAGVFLFFAVISGILREENRRETLRELLKTKLLFLQAQISPHFLYNALNTIAAISRRENAIQAHHLILNLAHFLRRTLKRADEMVSLKEEMDYIEAYLEIEKARFQDRLKVRKEIAIRDENWELKIPLLIVQPLVENAIKHGISKKEAGGTVMIRLADQNGCLKMEISDDGPGMTLPPSEIPASGETDSDTNAGIGINNIHERLLHLYGKEYGLQFESAPGQGTKVTVRIPYGDKS